MKVSELRPCDQCGGPIAPMFYRVRFDLALIKPEAVNQFLGMHQFFGGKANLALIENFSPASADAVTFAGDEQPALLHTAFICNKCFLGGKADLPMLMERLAHTGEKADA